MRLSLFCISNHDLDEDGEGMFFITPTVVFYHGKSERLWAVGVAWVNVSFGLEIGRKEA